MSISEILLRRKNKVILSDGTQSNKPEIVGAFCKNIESLGFYFAPEVISKLLTCNNIQKFYADVYMNLLLLKGADKEYNMMYPNFPHQVMEADFAELFLNALIHYISYGTIMPKYKKESRLPLLESTELIQITLGSEEDVWEIFENLISSRTSISQQDKKDIAEIVKAYPNYTQHLPEIIPFKENAAYVSKLIVENAPVVDAGVISKYFNTATDVLRFITTLSDGDISLAEKTHYRSLKRKERRMVMDLLADIKNIIPDMFKYKEQWIRVGEIVHPFEFKAPKHNKVVKAFDTLRNDKKPHSVKTDIHNAVVNKDTKTAVKLLSAFPGEFARNLDKLLRDTKDTDFVLKEFDKVADKVSVPVLLQLREHFMNRNTDYRVFFPKGNISKAMAIENTLPPIDNDICEDVCAICREALISLFEKKEKMGKVYIAPEFKKFIVPFAQRSASKTNKIVTKGSRIPVSKDYIRAFIWWTNAEKDRADIDLSCVVFDEKWENLCVVDYRCLRSKEMNIVHSGDITNGGDVNGDGVAEFLDINIPAVVKNGGRYIAFTVYLYNGTSNFKFKDLPNAAFGFMEKENPDFGKVFEPKTVNTNIALTANETQSIPVIFDCVKKEFIWADMGVDVSRLFYDTRTNFTATLASCYSVVNMTKTNMFDLISLNVAARGDFTTDRNEADIIFDTSTKKPVVTVNDAEVEKDIPIITPYDVDYFMSQLM